MRRDFAMISEFFWWTVKFGGCHHPEASSPRSKTPGLSPHARTRSRLWIAGGGVGSWGTVVCCLISVSCASATAVVVCGVIAVVVE